MKELRGKNLMVKEPRRKTLMVTELGKLEWSGKRDL